MGKVRVKTIGIEDLPAGRQGKKERQVEEKKKLKERNEAKKAEAAKRKAAEENTAKGSSDVIPDSDRGSKKIDSRLRGNDNEEIAASPSAPVKQAGSLADAQSAPHNDETKSEKKTVKKESKYKAKTSRKAKPHSASYLAMAKLVDKNKTYSVDEAFKILTSEKRAKFDETVELHINTIERGVSGNITLPHGTGKTAKIEIADHATDPKHVEELIKKIEGGQVDFDVLIATPETMVHLAKVARYLGPKGLMPNPKNGTISPKPNEAMKKFEGGQVNFKTEAKAPIIHMSVGKLSYGEKNLNANIKTVLTAVQTKNIKNVTLKSTMSPGIKITV
ncbi:MAG TPA: hypothetical protein VNA13_04630 [Xanthomonadales bacterium]|nr:hypothetical protein [Xanthomonadales bacterium]